MDDLFQAAMLRATGVAVPKVRIPVENIGSSSSSLSTSVSSSTSATLSSKESKENKQNKTDLSTVNPSKDTKGAGNKRPRSESPSEGSQPVNKEAPSSSSSSSKNSLHSSSTTSLRSSLAPIFCPSAAGATDITNDCGFRLGKHISLPSLCTEYTLPSSSSLSASSSTGVVPPAEATLCHHCQQGPAAHVLIDIWYPSLPDTRNPKKNQYLTLSSTIAWRRRIYVLLRNIRALIYTPKQSKEHILPYTLSALRSVPIEETIHARSTKLFEMIKEILEILQHLRTMTSYSTVSGTIADGNIITSGWIDKLQQRIDLLNTNMVKVTDASKEDGDQDIHHLHTRARDALRCVTALESAYMELFVADVGGGVGMGKFGTTLPSPSAKDTASTTATYLYASIPPPHLHLQTLVNKFPDIINDNNRNDLFVTDSTISTSSSTNPSTIRSIVYNKNMLLQYLQLREIEAHAHLQIPRLFNSALFIEGAQPGPYESTLRGTDPLTAPSIREWWNVCRDRVAAWTAFACPTFDALHEIYTFAASPLSSSSTSVPNDPSSSSSSSSTSVPPRHPTIIEIGAGTGYWAALLQSYAQGKITVKAYDTHPPFNIIRRNHGTLSTGNHSLELLTNTAAGKLPTKNVYVPSNNYHGPLPAWTTVTKGDTGVLTGTNVNKHTVLFLCYPPPNDDRMALGSLTQFTVAGGQRLALVGEFRGDTGSVNFEKELANEWKLMKMVTLPNFDNTVASLTLWERYIPEEETTANYVFKWPLQCQVCEKYPRAPWERKSRNSKGTDRTEGDNNGEEEEEGNEQEEEETVNGSKVMMVASTSKRVRDGFARDRLTRNVIVCCNACGNDPKAIMVLNRELAQRHLPEVVNAVPTKSEGKKKNNKLADPTVPSPSQDNPFEWDKTMLWRYGRLI